MKRLKEVDEWFGKNTRATIDAAAKAKLPPSPKWDPRFAHTGPKQRKALSDAYHQRRQRILREIYNPSEE